MSGWARTCCWSLLQGGLTAAMIHAWAKGTATPGDVAFAITAFMLMSGYLRNMGENIRMLQKGLDDTEDLAAWEGLAPQIADAPGAPDFIAAPGRSPSRT
jgi:ATP-binding cassette subfamily B protein